MRINAPALAARSPVRLLEMADPSINRFDPTVDVTVAPVPISRNSGVADGQVNSDGSSKAIEGDACHVTIMTTLVSVPVVTPAVGLIDIAPPLVPLAPLLKIDVRAISRWKFSAFSTLMPNP